MPLNIIVGLMIVSVESWALMGSALKSSATSSVMICDGLVRIVSVFRYCCFICADVRPYRRSRVWKLAIALMKSSREKSGQNVSVTYISE